MWILVAEAFGALGLLLFIVWWTLGPTHRRERDAMERAELEAARERREAAAVRSTAASPDVASSDGHEASSAASSGPPDAPRG